VRYSAVYLMLASSVTMFLIMFFGGWVAGAICIITFTITFTGLTLAVRQLEARKGIRGERRNPR
jgi:predicted membrane channel-forming protein YqfA (hemolysin III family)